MHPAHVEKDLERLVIEVVSTARSNSLTPRMTTVQLMREYLETRDAAVDAHYRRAMEQLVIATTDDTCKSFQMLANTLLDYGTGVKGRDHSATEDQCGGMIVKAINDVRDARASSTGI